MVCEAGTSWTQICLNNVAMFPNGLHAVLPSYQSFVWPLSHSQTLVERVKRRFKAPLGARNSCFDHTSSLFLASRFKDRLLWLHIAISVSAFLSRVDVAHSMTVRHSEDMTLDTALTLLSRRLCTQLMQKQ